MFCAFEYPDSVLIVARFFSLKRRKMATKEEELQRKREEAERKARRGEIDPTHEFTFQVSISSKFVSMMPLANKLECLFKARKVAYL
jgi:hypothetical protein